ncbi:MAG TPA: transposase [Anaerolineae bacterium]|nr:transposase [Anaerolineae bacterium]
MGRRFLRYIDRYFHFSEQVAGLKDTRVRPDIPLRAIYMAAFLMFACRYRSINALATSFRDKEGHWPKVLGKRLPSADRMGGVMDGVVCADQLRQMLDSSLKRAQRMKALHQAKGIRYRVGSVDAHEQFCTRHGCCEGCLLRYLTVDGQIVLEYYHRFVAFELIGVEPSVMLDLEPVRLGEDEVAAAERLVERVVKHYPSVCKVIVADAAYQEAPFFRRMRALGKHVIAVLKDERRDLYKDVAGMLRHRQPEQVIEEKRDGRGQLIRRVVIQLWDCPGMQTWPQLGTEVRVVCCDVRTTQRTRRGTEWVMETTENRWWWATDLTVEQASAMEIMRMGRRRWVEENTFNELVKHWAMDHRFKHAANAIVTFLLTLFLAHFLEHLFHARGMQPEARRDLTCVGLGDRLRTDLSGADRGRAMAPT